MSDIKLTLTKEQTIELWNISGMVKGSASTKVLHVGIRKRLVDLAAKFPVADKTKPSIDEAVESKPFLISPREHRAIADGLVSLLNVTDKNVQEFGFLLDVADYTRTATHVMKQIGEEKLEPITPDPVEDEKPAN